jgi:Resolvase, N terminal domain
LIVVWKLDRAFRSVVDGANTLQSLRSGGCGIRSLQEPWIDTTTPIGEAMYHITIAWAQLEKRQLTERVKAGMERARAEGKSLGRPQRSRPVIEHPLWAKVVSALDAGHINRAEAARKLRVRRSVLIDVLASFPNGGAVLVARLNSSKGSASPFPKDVSFGNAHGPAPSAVRERYSSSSSSSADAGSRSGRTCPGSEGLNAYRPRKWMCLKPSGESRATSSSCTG